MCTYNNKHSPITPILVYNRTAIVVIIVFTDLLYIIHWYLQIASQVGSTWGATGP